MKIVGWIIAIVAELIVPYNVAAHKENARQVNAPPWATLFSGGSNLKQAYTFTPVSRTGSPISTGRVQAVDQDSGLGRAGMSISDSLGNLGRSGYAVHKQTLTKKDERDQERTETLINWLSASDKFLENMGEVKAFMNQAVQEGIISPLENPSNREKLYRRLGRMAGEEISRDILTDPNFSAQLNTLGVDGDASLLFREALRGRMADIDESLHEDILASPAVREAEARAVAQGRSVQADEMDRAMVREAKTALGSGDLEKAKAILEGVRDATQRMPDVVKAAIVGRVAAGDFSGAVKLLEASRGLEVAGASYGEPAYAEHRMQLDGYIHRQRAREAGANSARVQIASGQIETALQTLARQQGTHVMDVSQVNEWAENIVAEIEAGEHEELAERIATESGLPRDQVEFQMISKARGLANARSQEIEHAARFEDSARARLRAMQVEAVKAVVHSVELSKTQGDHDGAREQIDLALADPELDIRDRVKLMRLRDTLENPVTMAMPATHYATVKMEPVEGQAWRSPTTNMEFVWVKALGIWVGKYEVTNGEYRRFVPGHNSGGFRGHSLNGNRQPVVRVNFDDAKAYAAWMTAHDRAAGRLPAGFRYRLPTEAEFTAYAQAGKNWEYPWGNHWPPVSGRAGNYADDTAKKAFPDEGSIRGYNDGRAVSAPVEQSWENPWGLFGVGGNVSEMATTDASNRSFGAWRGGSWYGTHRDYLRVSYRYPLVGSFRSDLNGFRLVLSR